MSRLKGKRIIDLSIDHRADPEWVYGLPELNREQIRGARQVASAGCYATSIILGSLPIKNIVYEVNVTSTSGISGAGFEVEPEDNFLVYKEGRLHQHIREIERSLDLSEVLFVPERVDNTYRGIISKVFAKINAAEDLDLIELYKEFYEEMPFVRVQDEKYNIETKNVNGSNFCDIKVSRFNDRIIAISALDNLGKGGSSQAIQNFNLMFGFDETTGLI